MFGVQGWVKVYSYTAQQEDILGYDPWYLRSKGSNWEQTKVISGKRQGKGLVARIEDVTDRDLALSLNGYEIGVQREDLPAPSKDEYYWTDLVGLEVVSTENRSFGNIEYLFETGANDVMVVKGERERWLPWIIGDVVKSVELSVGKVVVDWDPEF